MLIVMGMHAAKMQAQAANNKQEFQVDSIVGKRKQANGEYKYRVRWFGYGSDDDTWEPMENLSGCDVKVKLFDQRKQVLLFEERAQVEHHVACKMIGRY